MPLLGKSGLQELVLRCGCATSGAALLSQSAVDAERREFQGGANMGQNIGPKTEQSCRPIAT